MEKLSPELAKATNNIVELIYANCKGFTRIASGHWLRPVVSSCDPEEDMLLLLNPGKRTILPNTNQNNLFTSLIGKSRKINNSKVNYNTRNIIKKTNKGSEFI